MYPLLLFSLVDKLFFGLILSFDVWIICVRVMGGVGKTTLVKKSEKLLKTTESSSKLFFRIVLWVTMPKPPTNIRFKTREV